MTEAHVNPDFQDWYDRSSCESGTSRTGMTEAHVNPGLPGLV